MYEFGRFSDEKDSEPTFHRSTRASKLVYLAGSEIDYILSCVRMYYEAFNTALELKGMAYEKDGTILKARHLKKQLKNTIPTPFDWVVEKAVTDLIASFVAKKGIATSKDFRNRIFLPQDIEFNATHIKMPHLGWKRWDGEDNMTKLQGPYVEVLARKAYIVYYDFKNILTVNDLQNLKN